MNTVVPFLMWRIWRAGTVIEERLNSAHERAADVRRGADELQRILDQTRKSKETSS